MSLIDLVRQIHDAQFCERDGFPLIKIGEDVYCSVEYADGLIGGQKVIGVAGASVDDGPEAVELLFANGYRLPLTEPGSGEPQIARPGMLPHLRTLLTGRTLEGFRHGEWVSQDVPPERRPMFALLFSGEEPQEERLVKVGLESVKGIGKG